MKQNKKTSVISATVELVTDILNWSFSPYISQRFRIALEDLGTQWVLEKAERKTQQMNLEQTHHSVSLGGQLSPFCTFKFLGR